MRHQSKPTEVVAMQWHGPECPLQPDGRCAEWIVAWVNANDGEARYVPAGPLALATGQRPLIGVRRKDGWAYAAPGQHVVMGSASFSVDDGTWEDRDAQRVVRDFYPQGEVRESQQ